MKYIKKPKFLGVTTIAIEKKTKKKNSYNVQRDVSGVWVRRWEKIGMPSQGSTILVLYINYFVVDFSTVTVTWPTL